MQNKCQLLWKLLRKLWEVKVIEVNIILVAYFTILKEKGLKMDDWMVKADDPSDRLNRSRLFKKFSNNSKILLKVFETVNCYRAIPDASTEKYRSKYR